ncbi:rolling circle replication-associated protein [Rubricoccus marinus]|uniref:Replication-associated protein ORF2/G2P domain-containing protein n=1 Tax=Rubricoccus marinus TaxID=716817 RepID=A0A259TXG3_9BACT|nr:hypothetical protein [Rubricoccus marinus]OZC02401.1 hypothetical protein BSZ36_05075 [Rubricoccus marinus]
MTLTLDPKAVEDTAFRPFKEALVRSVWVPFAKNLAQRCRRAGERLQYVVAVERGEEKHPHIHGVISCPLPNPEDAIVRGWYRSGGGAAHQAEPVYGGATGLAAWLSYSLKEHFYPGDPCHHLMTSHGLGYNSRAAVAERRKHAPVFSGREIITDLDGNEVKPTKPAADRCARAAPPIPARLSLERRTKSHTNWKEGQHYAVRTSFDTRGRPCRDVVHRLSLSSTRGTAVSKGVSAREGREQAAALNAATPDGAAT